MNQPGLIRAVYEINGTVQGVGFRPSVYRLARSLNLGGSVQNSAGTVRLTLEGSEKSIRSFLESIESVISDNASISEIKSVSNTIITGREITPFIIDESEVSGIHEVQIPADLAVCSECLNEIYNRNSRRFGYEFTTCTDCGPRYTVVSSMPYDRERTSLAGFPLCSECMREYNDPEDRRYHAESTACPECGPAVNLLDRNGTAIDCDALSSARRLIADGEIVAIRGIGGFLLAANALSPDAVEKLRKRKNRPHKPFAVMVFNADIATEYCSVSDKEKEVLESPRAPILILNMRKDKRSILRSLSPDTDTLGVMLPSSPLHALLLQPALDDPTPPFEMLVMTSGNRGGEPIAISNSSAVENLEGIADAFLVHNREINLRNDDSLCAVQPHSGFQIWRRARGFSPDPISITTPLRKPILSMGSELKSTIALGFNSSIYMSPHIGDLSNLESVKAMEQASALIPQFLKQTPQAVAVDLNPDMHSSKLGEKIASELNIPVIRVQHHYAHALSCLADNGRTEGLALVLDGTGIGDDGTIWGAELLEITESHYRRLATFEPAHLPGGDKAVQNPVRQLAGRWIDAGIEVTEPLMSLYDVSSAETDTWSIQIEKGINAPLSHSAGRLFDSVAAAMRITPSLITYEGQGAIRLEAEALRTKKICGELLPFSSSISSEGLFTVNWSPMFERLTEDQSALMPYMFHQTLASALTAMVEYGLSLTQHREIALTGGVFMNRLLCSMLIPKIQKRGASVLVHSSIPPNDGAISAGQIIAASRSL